jgi:thiamine-phosphate pyrophosphorylase
VPRTSAALPRLWAISDRRSLAPDGPTFTDWVAALAGAGVGGLQIREKDLDDLALFALAASAREPFADGLLVVNGRADIALAAAADGVHLPADGLPVAPLRQRFGPDFWIGCSTHSLAEVRAAYAAGADYALFGPIYRTPSKEPYGPPQGIERLAAAAASTLLPVIAVGGIGVERFREIAAAGAAGAAGIALFRAPAHLQDVVDAAREAFA